MVNNNSPVIDKYKSRIAAKIRTALSKKDQFIIKTYSNYTLLQHLDWETIVYYDSVDMGTKFFFSK